MEMRGLRAKRVVRRGRVNIFACGGLDEVSNAGCVVGIENWRI